MNRLSFVLLLTLGATACDDDVPPPKFDGGSQRDGQVTTDGGGDGSSLSDAKADLPGADGLVADLTFGDGGCVIGTVDNCTDCGDKCAPPTTNAASAQVVCIGSCAIACQGEFYDVNGKLDDGCEVEDTTIQASENNAKDLGSVPDWNAKVAFSGTLLSDDRTHVSSPSPRPTGRPDYFKLHVIDKTLGNTQAEVSLSLAALPASVEVEVSMKYICDQNPQSPLGPFTQTVTNQGTTKIAEKIDCDGSGNASGDDSGTVIVWVRKLKGDHSAAQYSGSINP
ncbi:MAG: hypothetical protein H6707_13140 [Deltaproteobacteria bacterium]|nr:hypothetical protein [Deltaproteobacteria bacterium]